MATQCSCGKTLRKKRVTSLTGQFWFQNSIRCMMCFDYVEAPRSVYNCPAGKHKKHGNGSYYNVCVECVRKMEVADNLTTNESQLKELRATIQNMVSNNGEREKNRAVTEQRTYDKITALEKDNESLQRVYEELKDQLNKRVAAAEAAAKEKQEELKKTLSEQRVSMEAVLEEIRGRAQDIAAEIECEEKDIAQFEVERLDPSTQIIVTLGMTGSGKSTLCNRLIGDESEDGDQGTAQISGNAQSCTQSNSIHRAEIEGHKLTVVDTPGLGDSFGKDRQHSVRLCEFLKGCGGINAFVLVRNGANVRFDKHFQNLLTNYHRMFGDLFLERLIVVATRIEDRVLRKYQKENREEELRDDICDLFDSEDLDIPVIPIGFDGYKESIAALVEAVPSDKHEFKKIKSPLDALRAEYAEVLREEATMKEKIQNIQIKVDSLNVEISRMTLGVQ